ncbi:GntR family transcriptional regulator [Paenibacillus silvisoli]|uniref:GntR family transcriptional regulator n=1 Tax=Paenibacillus silvisoli TaxID=3110539 RepID=UPI002805A13D|nr:GntR family transcriptional regulator [Paenibacillus silvisoli]
MPRESLRDEAYQRIYEQIVTGALAKGSVTSEVHLSHELDMSRTPVRAALQQLEAEGFLRIIPKHGVLVLDSSAQRIGDLLELVAALLLYAATSARMRDAAALEELSRRLLAELDELLDAGADEHALGRFEYDFLSRVLALGHNQEMQRTLARSASRLFWEGNRRRWVAPYRLEMADALRTLLVQLSADTDRFAEALNLYVRMLKKTWV